MELSHSQEIVEFASFEVTMEGLDPALGILILIREFLAPNIMTYLG